MNKSLLALAAFAATLAGPIASSDAACPSTIYTQLVPEDSTVNTSINTTLCQTPIKFQYGKQHFSYKAPNGTPVQAPAKTLEYYAMRPQVPDAAALKMDQFSKRVVSGQVQNRDQNRPAIIFLHGGAFIVGGGKPEDMNPYGKYFARLGFVSVMPNYTVVPQAHLDKTNGYDLTLESVSGAAQQDIQALIRRLRENATQLGINPNAIYVFGQSAGAITAIRLANRAMSAEHAGLVRDLDTTQQSMDSRVNGAISLSGTECVADPPALIKLFWGAFQINPGTCQQDPLDPTDAYWWQYTGSWDMTVKTGWAQQACLQPLYAQRCGTTRFTQYGRYPQYDGDPHYDDSVGKCVKRPEYLGAWGVDGLDTTPGGDHDLSNTTNCPSRTGIATDGTRTPGYAANATGPNAKTRDYRTIGWNTTENLTTLANAAP